MCFLGYYCITALVRCAREKDGHRSEDKETGVAEDSLVWYPGRTFDYKLKFNDLQAKQHETAKRIGLPRPPVNRKDAASMRKQLVEIKTNDNLMQVSNLITSDQIEYCPTCHQKFEARS